MTDQTRPMTKDEAQRHDKCDRCGHAAYWVNHAGAKSNCSPFADDPGGPVKLQTQPAKAK